MGWLQHTNLMSPAFDFLPRLTSSVLQGKVRRCRDSRADDTDWAAHRQGRGRAAQSQRRSHNQSGENPSDCACSRCLAASAEFVRLAFLGFAGSHANDDATLTTIGVAFASTFSLLIWGLFLTLFKFKCLSVLWLLFFVTDDMSRHHSSSNQLYF